MFETDETLTDTKGVAKLAVVSWRTVQNWVAQKKIPVIRISPRCVRFDQRAVAAAMAKFIVKEGALRLCRSKCLLGYQYRLILTKQEAAAFIRCTTRYLERMVKAGRLKVYRPVDFSVKVPLPTTNPRHPPKPGTVSSLSLPRYNRACDIFPE